MKLQRHMILFFISLMITPLFVHAIGLSPATAAYTNIRPGGYQEGTLLISTVTDTDTSFDILTTGEIKDWLQPTEKIITIRKGSPHNLHYAISPPDNIPPGTYTGGIVIRLNMPTQGSEGFDPIILPQIISRITIQISGDETSSCTAGGLSIDDTETEEPARFSFQISNLGNIQVLPSYAYTVWDLEEINILSSGTGTMNWLLPTQTRTLSDQIATLPQGDYTIVIRIPECDTELKKTFSVLSRGSIKDKGTFSPLVVPKTSTLGTTIDINPAFTNQGIREMLVQFKGKVFKGDTLIDVIESEELIVNPQETITIPLLYTPEEQGTYTITGRIIYNTHQSEEQEITLIIKEPSGHITGAAIGSSGTQSSLYLIIAIVMTTTLFITLIILKKNRMRKHKNQPH